MSDHGFKCDLVLQINGPFVLYSFTSRYLKPRVQRISPTQQIPAKWKSLMFAKILLQCLLLTSMKYKMHMLQIFKFQSLLIKRSFRFICSKLFTSFLQFSNKSSDKLSLPGGNGVNHSILLSSFSVKFSIFLSWLQNLMILWSWPLLYQIYSSVKYGSFLEGCPFPF